MITDALDRTGGEAGGSSTTRSSDRRPNHRATHVM
ncbi:hypothetical protein GZL_06501 [Streptomyces sp. 769]|nr:hypothetical protein GZL_06501 [Streptomyces sp. 769]